MYGDHIKGMVDELIRVVILVFVTSMIVTACLVACVMTCFAPTPDSIQREQHRQAVIQTLTEEQKQALGISK